MSLDDDLAEFTGQRYQSWPGQPERGERRFPLGPALMVLPGLLAGGAVLWLLGWAFLALAT